VPSNKAFSFGFNTINGFFLNPYVSFGLGIGLEYYRNPYVNMLPFFLDARVYLEDDYDTTFIFLDAGSLVKTDNNFKRGAIIQLGIGYKYLPNKEKGLALVTDIAYSYRGISLDGQSIRRSGDFLKIRGVNISVGLIF